jgi:deferrochelatase/peroxidase EfeB
MTATFADVQRIVLSGRPADENAKQADPTAKWHAARHLMLRFERGSTSHFLRCLLKMGWPSVTAVRYTDLQVSLGFTRRGLERVHVPAPLLSLFALKSPAFWAGASQRAASNLGLCDRNAPERWAPSFEDMTLDAVISVHAVAAERADEVAEKFGRMLRDNDIGCTSLVPANTLGRPHGVELPQGESKTPGQWVHFGYRDGVSRVGIEGFSSAAFLRCCRPVSRYQAGEFVLGHEQDSGGNPWIAGPGLAVWPERFRSFFRNGSFGVLQQIEQDVGLFERFVAHAAARMNIEVDVLKGKLCGRYPDGRSMAMPNSAAGEDFDYAADSEGCGCPFGSHVRRMNPRVPPGFVRSPNETHLERFPAQFSRSRPLLRRGMPYGKDWVKGAKDGEQRGLIGQFFCASIEDQYEHLLSEWADRVPMGSPDKGGARDPFVGAHERGDGRFDMPPDDPLRPPLNLFKAFTRTVGVAYLFYPSRTTLKGIADTSLWGTSDRDEES